MVRISKYRLKEETLAKLYQIFFNVLISFRSKEKFVNILDDIFSPTEKIMMAKRIMLIYLIMKGIDQKAISKGLKLSISTVSKYAIIFYSKETDLTQAMKVLMAKERIRILFDDILADLFIQPGVKLGHWKLYWRNRYEKEKRQERGF